MPRAAACALSVAAAMLGVMGCAPERGLELPPAEVPAAELPAPELGRELRPLVRDLGAEPPLPAPVPAAGARVEELASTEMRVAGMAPVRLRQRVSATWKSGQEEVEILKLGVQPESAASVRDLRVRIAALRPPALLAGLMARLRAPSGLREPAFRAPLGYQAAKGMTVRGTWACSVAWGSAAGQGTGAGRAVGWQVDCRIDGGRASSGASAAGPGRPQPAVLVGRVRIQRVGSAEGADLEEIHLRLRVHAGVEVPLDLDTRYRRLWCRAAAGCPSTPW